jgi:hypothetical protein
MSWWCQKSQQKKLLRWKNFLYKSCRKTLDLSTLQITLKSEKEDEQDLSYTLSDLNFTTWFSPCSMKETRWDMRQLKDFDERNNFSVEGATIRDHLRGRFGSGCLEI